MTPISQLDDLFGKAINQPHPLVAMKRTQETKSKATLINQLKLTSIYHWPKWQSHFNLQQQRELHEGCL